MRTETWQKRILVIVILFCIIFLIDINTHKLYESRTDVLLVAKNEKISANFGSTIGNIKQIISSLAFYDRISADNDALEPGRELPNYKRKEFWNEKLAVDQIKGSGVISIRNYDSDSLAARELNDSTTESLIEVIGSYYNISTDLDIRIVDGPIVQKVVVRNLFASLFIDLLWTLLLYGVFLALPKLFLKSEKTIKRIPGSDFWNRRTPPKSDLPVFEEDYFSKPEVVFEPKKIVPEEIIVESKPEKIAEISPTPIVSYGKKAPTPANLPVSEEGIPEMFLNALSQTEKPSVEAVSETEVEAGDTSREATAEEVKERLNRLLRGGK